MLLIPLLSKPSKRKTFLNIYLGLRSSCVLWYLALSVVSGSVKYSTGLISIIMMIMSQSKVHNQDFLTNLCLGPCAGRSSAGGNCHSSTELNQTMTDFDSRGTIPLMLIVYSIANNKPPLKELGSFFNRKPAAKFRAH